MYSTYGDLHLNIFTFPTLKNTKLVKNTPPRPWQTSLRWDKQPRVGEGFDARSDTKHVTQESIDR